MRKLSERLEVSDLQYLVSDNVSLGEFEPKTGSDNEVIVLAFYVKEESPAQDLGSFLERGTAKTLDTEVSPNPDENGFYLLFVEIENNEDLMHTVFKLLVDADRVCSVDQWDLSFHNGGNYTVDVSDLKKWIKAKK
jgi:hypothetical protein